MLKENTISFKVSGNEKRQLEYEANIRNMSVSQYLRTSFMHPTIQVIDKGPEIAKHLCLIEKELKYCGLDHDTEINQEVRKIWLCLKR